MLTFRDITLADRELVMPMVQAFYQTAPSPCCGGCCCFRMTSPWAIST